MRAPATSNVTLGVSQHFSRASAFAPATSVYVFASTPTVAIAVTGASGPSVTTWATGAKPRIASNRWLRCHVLFLTSAPNGLEPFPGDLQEKSMPSTYEAEVTPLTFA